MLKCSFWVKYYSAYMCKRVELEVAAASGTGVHELQPFFSGLSSLCGVLGSQDQNQDLAKKAETLIGLLSFPYLAISLCAHHYYTGAQGCFGLSCSVLAAHKTSVS